MKLNKYNNTIFSLKKKNAVVVGGLGQIGTNTVKILLEAGANVEVIDFENKDTNKEFEKISNLYKKNNLIFSKLDITNEKEVNEKIKKTSKNFRSIDILINHAHYKGDTKTLKPYGEFFLPFENYPFDVWKKTLDVNLNGLFLITKAVGSYMKKQKYGVIVNTSSTYGIVSPNKSIYEDSGINSPISYAVTKAAILNFSRYLATHWAEYNIRVNTLSPGGVDNINQSFNFKKNYSTLTPLNRLANANEFQGAILFLVSDASSYMTGSNLVVDGGWTAW